MCDREIVNSSWSSEMPSVLIAHLSQYQSSQAVQVRGWVEAVRDQKNIQFVIIRDESGAPLQLLYVRSGKSDCIAEKISSLSIGSFVRASGVLKHNERVKLRGLEVEINNLDVVSTALPSPIAHDSSIDKRLDWRFLDLRNERNNLIFRIQTYFLHALRTWWVRNGFIEINTPKLMASSSESRAELFSLKYFDRIGYLAQSPQFFKQMSQAAGFGKVFEIAPVYRADPSFTSRHATEYTSIDSELSWIESHEDVMNMQEELLTYSICDVLERHSEEIRGAFGLNLCPPKRPFVRVTLEQALNISARSGHISQRHDLDPEAERRVGKWALDNHASDFVFVTNYPVSVRPFYHMRENENITKSYDLLFRGIEIATGAQREHRYDVLVDQAREKGLDLSELGYYLDFFRYGMPPHGGFGAGLARIIMALLRLGSIKESTFLFRGPNRLLP